jgi:hypothetical protein
MFPPQLVLVSSLQACAKLLLELIFFFKHDKKYIDHR